LDRDVEVLFDEYVQDGLPYQEALLLANLFASLSLKLALRWFSAMLASVMDWLSMLAKHFRN